MRLQDKNVDQPEMNLRLLAWSQEGVLVVEQDLQARTVSLSGKQDCDISVPALGDDSVFLRLGKDRVLIFYQHSDHRPGDTVELTIGETARVGMLYWSVLKSPVRHPVEAASVQPLGAGLASRLLDWMARPMGAREDLRGALVDFLDLALERSRAISGMLVLADHDGFSLASYRGLSLEEAHRFWDSMPEQLSAEILRTQARVLLPEGFQNQNSAETTVYIRGMRSIVGFPVQAEGRLLAILYLGFHNLMRELSRELQLDIEQSCAVLGLIVQRGLLRAEVESVRFGEGVARDAFPHGRLMLGSSPEMADVYRRITRIAPVDINTLIVGETGTGKELAAREIHRLSPRSDKPFIVFNVAAVPESLFEAEMFGYRRGSFTGALTDRKGMVEMAHEGTLFIDEIGELSLPLQAKLLRVLQEREVSRIGDEKSRSVDFRLVTATHRDLPALVKKGKFREDLYYRIAGTVIVVPSLRERRGDVLELANFFRQQFATRHGLPLRHWSPDAVEALRRAPWPGNVRELEHAVSRAFIMADGEVIRAQDLQLSPDDHHQDDDVHDVEGLEVEGGSLADAKQEWLKAYISESLKRHDGNRAKTAKNLGIGQRTLFRYIEQLGIRGV